VVGEPDAVIAMNGPSTEKFMPMVKPHGVLIVNRSIVGPGPRRGDIRVIEVECNEIADALGSPKVATMVAIGALLEATHVLPPDAIVDALRVVLPARRHGLIPVNEQALAKGAEAARAAACAV
jgi:2-oxoglutarate ferredoxin oxidoreductase subunit gamma